MAEFSKSSLDKLATLDLRLADILTEAIKIVDFTILEGHREKDAQDTAYMTGTSKLQWPNSKHNHHPSMAVDIAPYPIDWHNIRRFCFLGGIIKAIAHTRNIEIRWGYDWDSDNDFDDQTFNDLPHFEIREP